ncbi:MAG: MBL fold metallo-hydrolase [Treponema sp.]|nr:MBL fold metallo-hydrolase [Treponema sp.]
MIKLIHTGPFATNSLVVPLPASSERPLEQPVFIVDPACCDFSHDRYAVSRYLESEGLRPVAIVLTHGHFDHVAGIGFLKELYPEIKIYIHAEDASFIGEAGSERQAKHLSPMGFLEFLPSVTGLCAATDFISDGDVLFAEYGSPWKVMHTPGHTEGSCVLYSEKEKTLIAGDTLFYRSWGRTDLPGGSESRIMMSLKRIYGEIPLHTRVYPGHDRAGFLLEESPLL